MIRFAYFGRNSYELLTVDIVNKKYSYWANIKIDENIPVIQVKRHEDLTRLLENLLDYGYSDN